MEKSFSQEVGNTCAFLIAKMGEVYAVTDILYEKLAENNIDMSDFKERCEAKKKDKTRQMLDEFKSFNDGIK